MNPTLNTRKLAGLTSFADHYVKNSYKIQLLKELNEDDDNNHRVQFCDLMSELTKNNPISPSIDITIETGSI